MRSRRFALAVLFATVLAGCAPSARFVVVEPNGGTVAIHRNTPKSREKALELIAQKCPRGYDIVREEEFVVGTRVTTEYSTEYDRVREEVRTTQEERSRTEVQWRITFTCR